MISQSADAPAHILLYTDDPESGGVAQYNHSVLTALARAGYRVTCVQSQSDGPLVRQQRELGVSHQWLPHDTRQSFVRDLDDDAPAGAIFEALQPELVIFSDCCPLSNLAAREAAKRMGVPYLVVVGFVGAYLADRFKARIPQLAAQYAAALDVVAVSRENLSLLHQRFGLSPSAGRVIHYGRPERYFTPRDAAVRTRLRAGLGIGEDAVLCFTAARLDPIKGYRYQLIAAKHLLAQPAGRRLHFAWAGEGAQRGEIETFIAANKLAGRVHLLGQRWDVADWYDAADIFVLPSDMEGMPLAIMEAMAKGLPVLATSVSGIPEEMGDTGRLLPAARNALQGLMAGMIQTLQQWSADPRLRARLGVAARARAVALFREERMVSDTLRLVSKAAQSPAGLSASSLTASALTP